MFQMIATMFEWLLVKNVFEVIAGICRMLTPNGLNYHVAFTLWFFRSYGQTGALICLNEVVLIRYVTKVVLKRIIVMNDALIGTWIQLSNVFVGLVLTGIQTQALGFQNNLLHLTNENLPKEGLVIGSHTFLFIMHIILLVIIGVHLCVNKFKERNTTPVIEIHIPNPQAASSNQANNQQIVINNQPYNSDLLDFSSYCFLVLISALVFFPSLLMHSNYVQTALAEYYEISVEECFGIFSLIRNFIQPLLFGLLLPMILMISSDELRPFLFKSLSCTNNNVMIEVYN